MDFQSRAGNKPGGGGVANYSDSNIERRERLKKLALETIDIRKDPYIIKNHLGTFECRLCLTLHTNEASYLAHTQGKKHQTNLARRLAKDAKDVQNMPMPKIRVNKRKTIKIGRPGYRVTKQKDPENSQKSLLFEIEYPEIEPRIQPRYRLMSAYEQKHEAPDDRYQYLLVAAEPYETIGFKIPNIDVDFSEGRHYNYWDKTKRCYTLLITFNDLLNKNASSSYLSRPTTFNPVGAKNQLSQYQK